MYYVFGGRHRRTRWPVAAVCELYKMNFSSTCSAAACRRHVARALRDVEAPEDAPKRLIRAVPSVPLNAGHSHFLFIDDGTVGHAAFYGEIQLRNNLEKALGDMLPSVLLALGRGQSFFCFRPSAALIILQFATPLRRERRKRATNGDRAKPLIFTRRPPV